jgi:hypothetical protein
MDNRFSKNNLKLEVLPVKALNGEELNVIKAQFVNGSGKSRHFLISHLFFIKFDIFIYCF